MHLAAYVRWDVILAWKAQQAQEGRVHREERLRPYAYGTAQVRLKKRARANDILWIVTLPRFSRHAAAPSLVARLHLRRVVDQQEEPEARRAVPRFIREQWDPDDPEKNWRYVALACKSRSRYYPVNDAYDLLRGARFVGHEEPLAAHLRGKTYGALAQHFQTIRELQPDSGNDLETYARRVENRRSIFISYRHGRYAGKVRQVVEGLLQHDVNCWLDENMMPQKIDWQHVPDGKERLESVLRNAVKQSDLFVALRRKDYYDSPWTTLEWEVAGDECERSQRAAHRPFRRIAYDLHALAPENVDDAVQQMLKALPEHA